MAWSAVTGDNDMMVVIVMMHGGSNNNNCGIDKYHELVVANKTLKHYISTTQTAIIPTPTIADNKSTYSRLSFKDDNGNRHSISIPVPQEETKKHQV
jgi:hypothetical protein